MATEIWEVVSSLLEDSILRICGRAEYCDEDWCWYGWGGGRNGGGGGGPELSSRPLLEAAAAAAAAEDETLPGNGEKEPGARWARCGCIVAGSWCGNCRGDFGGFCYIFGILARRRDGSVVVLGGTLRSTM